MALLLIAVYYVLLVFFVLMIARLVLEVVQSFSPEWRPRGAMLLVAEIVYTPTDPPLKALRSVLPPLKIGQIRLDLAFLVIMLVTGLVMNIVLGAAVRTST